MASVCKTWSLPASSINGLCASEYVIESGSNDCSLCVKPIENVGDPVVVTSDATTCIIWRQPDPLHFNGFCTNKFRLSTLQDHVRLGRGCGLCAGPMQIGISGCTGCSGDAPLSYLVDITIDGNGSSGGSPDYGCGMASYSGEFVLSHGPGNCIWSSAEKELRTYSSNGSGTDTVTCDAILDSDARPRVQLRLSTVSVTGVLKTVYSVTVNWIGGDTQNLAGGVFTSPSLTGTPSFPRVYYSKGIVATGLDICSVTSRGTASTLDCYEPVAVCDYYSRVINFGVSPQWANPYVNSAGGGDQITMTASVRPL